MSRNRAIGFVGVVVAIGAFAFAHSREALAAGTIPFTWSKYTAKDGMEYSYPQWNDAGGGKRELNSASGTLKFKQNPPVTKVVFQVYRHGAQGGWNATPVINYQLNPNPTYDAVVGGWTLVGKDNNVPKVQFDEGEEIKIVWAVTTTANGVDTVTNVELIVTVQYHAF
jgi:hypothetical protein